MNAVDPLGEEITLDGILDLMDVVGYHLEANPVPDEAVLRCSFDQLAGGLLLASTKGIRSVKNTKLLDYTVYIAKNEDGQIRYVGITIRDLTKRQKEHIRKGGEWLRLQFEVYESGLSRLEARILEQTLINQGRLSNLLNKINSIAQKYWEQYGIK